MGVTSCMNVRPTMTRPGGCHCPACPRAAAAPAHTLVLPPMALETEVQTPAKDKKGSKMKVLKKIKKKMGLAPRTACTGGAPNNLPPLSFHRVHGENVRLSRDAATARRVESFCKGVAFSARPVRVNEKVCLRFAEISNNWSGVLRFGFTSNDPANQAHCLPKYACPDLTNKPGYWAKALAERFCEKDNILYYYVTPAGDVHFGINGEEKGIFFSGVETRGALWALLDIYGNCTGVQFCDPRAPNQVRRSLPTGLSAESDDRLAGSLRSLSIDDQLPPPRFQSQAVVPLTLHRMRGRNIRFINDRGVAARIESEFCQGYVFTARPMRPGETLVVQILATESAYAGSLAIGLTSCDPATLRPSELPDDAESLLDRPEYWVVRRDAANGLRRGDEMAVTLTVDGEVRVSRNGSTPMTVMHVDHTLRLWAFVDVYGATQKVRLLGTSMPAQQVQSPPAQLRVQLANGGAALGAGNGGTVLVVSLPPQNGGQNNANHQQGLTLASAHYIEPIGSQSPQLCLTGLPQNWSQEPSLIQCASTSQNNANTSQQALADLQVPNGLPAHPTTSSNQCLASPPITTSCSDRINNQVHSGQSVAHAQSFPQHPSQLASHLGQGAAHSGQVPSHLNQNAAHSGQIPSHLNQNAAHSGQMASHLSQNAAHAGQIAHSSQIAAHSSQMQNVIAHPLAHSSSHAGILASSSHHQPIYSVIGDQIANIGATGAECTICYENPIDSVLYMCGHMCMCYRCAVQQWRGKGGGQCPLCRAHIKDVIRTYKS